MKSSFLKSILSKWPSMHSGSARPVGQTGKTFIFLPQDANINIEVVPSNWLWDALVSALQSTASQCKSSVRPWSAVSTLRLKSLYFWIWATRLSTGTQPVLPKPLRTPYLGVGHQTGPGPLCGTPQSPSQSARTFCRRNNTKWAEFTLMEHSSSHSQICQSTPNQPISFHPVFSATRGFLTVHNRRERNLISFLAPKLTEPIATPQRGTNMTLWRANTFYLLMLDSLWCSTTRSVDN